MSASEMTLNKPETMFLAAYLRQLTRWSPDAAVRVQTNGKAAGFYGSPLGEVITLITIPMAEPMAEDIDCVVSAGRLRDVIGDVQRLQGPTTLTLPDETSTPPSLVTLPPADGWAPSFTGVAADIAALIDPELATLAARTELLDDTWRERTIRERWAEPSWSALPFGVLHAARAHGFLNHGPAQIRMSTNGPWKRLATPAGQVFSRVSDGLARLLVVKD